jgi:hypothetical protein
MYPKGPFMIGAAPDGLVIVGPKPKKDLHRAPVAVYQEFEIEPMLPLEIVILRNHPEVI